MRNVYVYTAYALSMAKLYWRIKKDGKWTWQAAIYDLHLSEELMTERVHPEAELVTLWWPSQEEE